MYNAFYELIYNQLFNYSTPLDEFTFELMNRNCDMCEYIAILMALICTVTVYVICCLCVWKVIRLFGRLWSRF